jgi:WD40 repeat protein
MKPLRVIPLLLVTLLVGAGEKSAQPIPIAPLGRTTPVDFESEILPFLRVSCVACHSRTTAKSGLVLETPQTILQGSEDGAVIIPGKSAESRLLDLAAHADKPIMPPRDNKASAPDLTPAQLALLKLWIDQGARGEVHAEPIHWRPIASTFTPAYAAAVTSNGQFAAVGRANRLDLYDLLTLQLLPPLVDPNLNASGPVAHRDAIYALTFSPDGMRLASGSLGEVKIWRRTPPAATHSVNLDLGGNPVPDARRLGDLPGILPAWNREADRELRRMTHDTAVTAIASRPGGKRFASAGGDGVVKIWDVATRAVVRELKGDPTLLNLAADRDADDKLAAADVAYFTSRLTIAQADEKAQRERSKKADDARAAAEKSASEKQALVKSAAEGKLQSEHALADAIVARDRALAAVAQAEQALKAAQAAAAATPNPTSRPASTAPTTKSADPAALLAAAVKAVELAKAALPKVEAAAKQGGDRVAATAKPLADAEAALKVAELARLNAANEADLATAAVTRAAQAAAAAQVDVTSAESKKAKTTADLTLAQQNATASASRPIRALAFSPDGRTLAVAPEGSILHLWDAESGTAIGSIATGSSNDPLQSVGFIDADHLWTAADKHTATLWTIGNAWTLERTLGSGDAASPLADRVNAVVFSPDGRTLASGAGEPTRGGEIKFWDVATGSLVRALKDPHSDAVLALAFSRDGARLASGAADRFVRVFDVPTGRRIFSLEGHAHHILSVAFKADGRTLVSGAADGQAKLWNLVSGERMGVIPPVSKGLTSAHFIGATGQILLGASDGQFRIINEAGAPVRTFAGPASDHVHAAALASNNSTLLCATQSGTLYVLDASTGQPKFTLRAPDRK